MPPKRKGQNLRGKDKLFRNAVEHVHVGVGHTVLGDVSLHLAAGSAKHTHTATTTGEDERPAFYLELNEQLLSHSSKDFKKFRYEVLDLCETRALMNMSHRRIAEKLLLCLLDRSGGAVGNRAKSKTTKTIEGRGETGEGFAAFVRLTIAFARDMGPKFFPYFEVFHQAVHAGLFDRRGFLIADTSRVQLVFAAQAAWCRELTLYWCQPGLRRLVERALGVYVALLSDSRGFVRRLAAELLAYVCRLAHPLLPLVVEKVAAELLDDYQRYALRRHIEAQSGVSLTAPHVSEASQTDEKDDVGDDEKGAADEGADALADASVTRGEADEQISQVMSSSLFTTLPSDIVWNEAQSARYAKEVLRNHPVTESLGVFASELTRGIRGALSSSFEYFYLSLLECGLLLPPSEKAKVLAHDEVFMAAFGYEHMEESSVSGEEIRKEAHTGIHAGRYRCVFARTSVVEAADTTETADTPSDALDATAVPVAQELVRALMSLALQVSVQAVLREVRVNSTKQVHSDSEGTLDDGLSEDGEDGRDTFGDDNLAADESSAADAATITGGGHQRASTRLLHAVTAALVVSSVHHIHILNALLTSSYYYLWQDRREVAVLRRLGETLVGYLKSSARAHYAVPVVLHGALLEMLVPLCVTPYLCHPMALRRGVADAAAAHANDAHTLAVQKAFLPLGREVVQQLLRLASGACVQDGGETMEAARVTLYAFAQDVLHKQFAFYIAEERRATEEGVADRQPGFEADTAPYANKEGRDANDDDDEDDDPEDDYVPDDHDGGDGALGSLMSGKRLEARRRTLAARQAAKARAREAQSAEVVLKIKPLLTPLALTLLHALCSGYWSLANSALERRLATLATSSAAVEADADVEALASVLAARHVERAVLLVRLTHDRTRHAVSSPLQQLLRLKASSASSSSSTAAGLALRACVETMFSHLMHLFVRRTELLLRVDALQTTPSHIRTPRGTTAVAKPRAPRRAVVHLVKHFENEMELLACGLPALRDLLAVARSGAETLGEKAATHTATDLQAPLHKVLEVLRRCLDQAADITSTSELSALSLISPSSGYALYGQVASVLIYSGTGAALDACARTVDTAVAEQAETDSEILGKRGKRVHKARAVGAPSAAVFAHLAQAIHLLATAFDAGKKVTATSLTGPGGASAFTTSHTLSESERGQLMYATQVLLRSLLWSLGLPEDAHTAGARLSDATRRALRTLRQSLPDDCQARLVQSILLECLVSPMQSLRLLTLRLLVWLCHRDVPVEDRLAGLSPVDTTLLIALVRAEEFNPLSATGNLDGLKHVLAKATFAAESGTLTDPFERCVLARAMMGLYYLKFSGAWAAATRILHGLVRWEQTTPASVFIKAARGEHKSEADAHNEEDDESAVEPHGGGSGVRQRLEPVVWNTAIVPYAHLMVFGDVMTLESRATVAEAEVTALTDDDDDDMDADNEEAVAATLTGTSAARADEMHLQARLDSWATYRCPYAITLTDQQQHEKGAVVSRAFSSMQYTDDIIAAVDLASADGELISWQSHWVAQRDESTASGYLARSTDRVTLAQTFLGALEEMMKHSSAFDSKLRLVEDLVMELVAMDRNEHPLTSGHTHVRKLDERLCLAMRACAAAPTTVLSAGQQQRAEATVLAVITSRNKTLESLFASYTANANARLQRAALDNLKRLKLEPFHAHHTQLIPYCDSLKGLFAFLSSFHLDTIPAHDRGDYVATAITICLPKLIAKVSKDKRRDQAVLQRRLMGFLTELASLSSSAQGGAPASVDEVTQVLDRVTQRLVLSRVATTGELTDVDAFDFLGQWRTAVCEAQDRHAVRHLERQVRQLTHATRLLQSLLGAVGQRFASYVRSCLYLALQAYLVACRQHLRETVEARIDAITRTRQDKRERGESEDEEVRVQRWCEETLRALRTRGLSLAMTELRRTTVVVVVSLLEQFPSECIAVIEDMVDAAPADSDDPVRASIFGRYITALYANAKGVSQPSMPLQPDPAARAGVGKTVAKGTVTPMLRLLLAWSTREPLLPLIAAFGDEVTGTFAELFAVNPVYLEADQPTKLSARDGHRGAGMPPVHKAPAAAVYDALRCLSDLLARRDEPLRVLGHRTTAVEEEAAAKKTAEKRRGKAVQPSRDHPRASTRHTVTLQEAFLATHVTTIFTAVYKLIMHGDDDDDENDNNTNGRENEDSTHTGAGAAQPKKSAASTGGRFSVMAFSVPMWKEVIQTVSMLAQQMQRRAAATASTGAVTSAVEACEVQRMLGRLLEVSLKFVVHPMCITDAATVVMAVQVVRQLFTHLGRVDLARHYRPLVHLFNTVTNPEARLLLCDVAKAIVPKLALTSIAGVATGTESNDDAVAVREALAAQMAATARAVACLNSFDDNNDSLDRYDFDLRYHTFHSLQLFFANKGNYGARPAAQATKAHRGGTGTRDAVRHERDYSGELDVHLPVSKHTVPVLAIPAFQLLVANVMYFLRDPESTLRAQAVQLFYSMMRYAANALPVQSEDSTRHFDYAACVLEQVVRQGEVLSTLRHGVVSRDVHIRHDHMVCFGALGRHYASSFPSFHALCSSNTAQDFFQNVGHVQHKCRLHALALLRKLGSQMQLRDVLRVIVPFLMSAIKDFAQGKRDLQNMTDGRAKGYCDAVLHTIAALTEKMPWEAYYRVLTLFLSNAGANASLRMPMLRGVVQVLENFDFLDTEDGEDAAVAAATGRTKTTEGTTGGPDGGVEEDDDEDEDAIEDDDETVRAEVARRRRQFRHQRVLNVLEHDVLPQLLGFIGTGKEGQKTLGLTGELKGSNINTISSLRKEQEAEDKATSKNAILQLPVALAVTRIVKHFPEDRFDFYVDHLMDELVRKLRTKNDRHRDSARRILGAMLQETGPGKLRPIITKLQDNLVHGYQLHVLGYTVVTLLFQLYEPQAALVGRSGHHASLGTSQRHRHAHRADPVAEALEEVKKRRQEQQGSGVKHDGSDADNEEEEARENKHTSSSPAQDATLTEAEREDLAVETAEQELIDQLLPHATVFDHAYGVQCLTNLLDPLITIFLDDYLGEISEQKGQVELMSKMVEIKSSRAVQGFAFLARHAEATRMMDVFLQKVAWVLTPPSDSSVDVSSLHGSAKVKALMMHELRTKYVTVSKNASADLTFVNKVRLIAVRVARGLMMNPSMQVEQSFAQVRDLLTRHNATREEKILAFEAKDGTRRIRGNAHLVIHKAERATLREMRDKNFVVEPVPERVDVDFSAHTVLATQQRQKLRLYKGRYGRDLKEAAKDFYREDPATAVVLDTTDEFLLKYLLSVLKQVLGIGKERHYSKAAVQLDLLRHQNRKGTQGGADDDRDDTAAAAAVIVGEEHDNDEDREEMEVDKDDKDGSDAGEDEDANEDEDETALDPQDIDADGGDDLDEFAEAQAHYAGKADGAGRKGRTTAALLARHNLTAAFTREHRALLESLVPVVLHTLEGEGSDPVVGNALDCLLALVSLRPPLDTVHAIEANLLDTVAGFLMRGGAIKQRAMRVCAALICHQKFELTEDQAVRLVALARAEIIDRSEFLPMALSLFHAVLRKHIHVVEVYDLIDLVTELLVHLGAKRGIRYRCVQILVRFLTEFKLTPEKFRSHINLYCRNLDYPELSGTLALLELLDALAYRLPTVVLRDEAPVLLPPLAAVVLRGQWREARERAGQVIQHLVKLAGVDVLVPILSGWMDPAKPRPTREMAAQLWATMIPAIAAAYGLNDTDVANTLEDTNEAGDDAAGDEADTSSHLRESRDGFDQCCAWSLEAVLNGCLYNQYEAAGGRKAASGTTLTAKFKAKAEMKGWEHVFYSLRCAEALFVASPFRMYRRLGPALLPVLIDHLMLHTHPWVQAVSVRILRHYCYTFVEPYSGFLASDTDTLVAAVAEASTTGTSRGHSSSSSSASTLLVVPAIGAAPTATSAQLEDALRQAARALKQCLTRVAMSDVSNETYNAHRAINSPSRAESLKLMVFLLRTICVLVMRMSLLVHHAGGAPSARHASLAVVEKELRLVRSHLESVAKPVLRQGKVVNYMVRTASLVQLFGGLVSVLPTPSTTEDVDASHLAAVNEAATWLMGGAGLDVLRLVQEVAAPLVGIALRAANISDRLSTLAHQSASVMAEQLEARRPLLRKSKTAGGTATVGRKRGRSEEETSTTPTTPALDVVLGELTTHVAAVRQERRVKQITKDTRKSMKRNRREMDKSGSF